MKTLSSALLLAMLLTLGGAPARVDGPVADRPAEAEKVKV